MYTLFFRDYRGLGQGDYRVSEGYKSRIILGCQARRARKARSEKGVERRASLKSRGQAEVHKVGRYPSSGVPG